MRTTVITLALLAMACGQAKEEPKEQPISTWSSQYANKEAAYEDGLKRGREQGKDEAVAEIRGETMARSNPQNCQELEAIKGGDATVVRYYKNPDELMEKQGWSNESDQQLRVKWIDARSKSYPDIICLEYDNGTDCLNTMDISER